MKKIITLLVLMAGLYTATHAQCDKKWRDTYTNNYTSCTNPQLFYSTNTYTKNFSFIQGTSTICVPNEPFYGVDYPLLKTYVFTIIKLLGNGADSIVGNISKNNLQLQYPDDFNPFASNMTSGQYRIRLSVKINNPWNTIHNPSYQAKLNGTVIKTVANLEADSASRNFVLPIGIIDCFNFFKCFSASLSIPPVHFIGQPTKITAITNPPGNYTYYWIFSVGLDSSDSTTGCRKGDQPFPPDSTKNYIYLPCSPCYTQVICGIVDNNNPLCVVTTDIIIGRRPCNTTAGGGGTGTGNGRMAPTVAIKSMPGKQLAIENLPAKTQHTVKLMDYNGNQRKMWNIDQPTARLFVNNAEAGKLYVVIIESKGQVIARKHIVLQ